MARGPVRERDIAAFGPSLADHLDQAQRFEQLAADPHPRDEVSRALLLVRAGESWAAAGDTTRAVAAFRSAVEDGGDVAPDSRAYLAEALLRAGDHAEAEALLTTLRKERSRDAMLYVFLGEAMENAGDDSAALRWYTTGITRLENDDEVSDDDFDLLVVDRFGVRSRLGFEPDDYDELAMDLLDDVEPADGP